MLNTVTVDVAEWISTGSFSGVVVGMNKGQVHSIVGDPLGWADSSKVDEVGDFLDANIWGYGIWTFFFDDGVLDAVTANFAMLEEVGFYFGVSGVEFSANDEVDDILGKLAVRGIKVFELPREYWVREPSRVEISRKKRVRAERTFLVGSELLGRIMFERESEKLSQMAYPFSPVFQAIGRSAMQRRPGYVVDSDQS
ncbi:MAG: hypothetical protein ACOYXU_01990 [Nitrospirota bacterium]